MHIGLVFCTNVDIKVSHAKCNNDNNGEVGLSISNVQGSTLVRLMQAKNNKVVFSCNITIDTAFAVYNLSADDYILQIVSNGMSEEFNVKVNEPEKLKANKISVENYPDGSDNCNGIITVSPSGGTKPYSYEWIEGKINATSAHLEDLCEGIYTCKIQDANNCGEVKATVYLLNGFNQNANN
jgi:hypothetical protein